MSSIGDNRIGTRAIRRIFRLDAAGVQLEALVHCIMKCRSARIRAPRFGIVRSLCSLPRLKLLWAFPVVFDRKTAEKTEFQALDLLRPFVAVAEVPRNAPVSVVPVFLTPRNFFRHSWLDMLKVALTPYPANLTNIYAQLFRRLPVGTGHLALRPAFLSLCLHVLALVGLPFLLIALPVSKKENAVSSANLEPVVYYRIANLQHAKLPRIAPAGPGANPGSAVRPDMSPARGASKSLGDIFAGSHPRVPDNDHQTILQSQSAPELKVRVDLKLPNLIVPNRTAPKRPLAFHPGEVRPLQPVTKETAITDAAPSLKTTAPTPPLATLLSASDHPPRLAVPIGALPTPNLPLGGSKQTGDIAAPEIGTGTGTSAQGLLVLGTEPASPESLVALPPGNRIGQFSIAPGGSGAGSPGSSANGVDSGGTGGRKSGGNESVGIGSGKYDGGGGDSGGTGIVSLRGSGKGSESIGVVNSGVAEGMVFALPKLTGPRRLGIVVTAGPLGGGGLGVYGALHCGKVYSILLPISGKNWTLQFCQTRAPDSEPSTQSRSAVHMEQSLVPPEAEARYDFKRLPLPPDKVHKLIILKGTISSEGTVENLAIHQGLLPEVDKAALLAFSRWTFKPAMQAAKAVSVDVLVGIPGDLPVTGTGPAAKIGPSKTADSELGKNN